MARRSSVLLYWRSWRCSTLSEGRHKEKYAMYTCMWRPAAEDSAVQYSTIEYGQVLNLGSYEPTCWIKTCSIPCNNWQRLDIPVWHHLGDSGRGGRGRLWEVDPAPPLGHTCGPCMQSCTITMKLLRSIQVQRKRESWRNGKFDLCGSFFWIFNWFNWWRCMRADAIWSLAYTLS